MPGDREDPGVKAPLVAAEATEAPRHSDPGLGGQVLTDGTGRDAEVAHQRGLEVSKQEGEARVVASTSMVEHVDELGSEHAAHRRIRGLG